MTKEPELLEKEDFFDLSQLEIIRRLAGLGCNVTDICHLIGVSRATFYRRLDKYQQLGETLEKGKAEAKSSLLQSLYKQARDGDFRALAFSLTVIYGLGADAGKSANNIVRKSVDEMNEELMKIEARKKCLTSGEK